MIPDMIVVGVVNGADRTHDLTPPAEGQTATENPTAGGADSLLGFLSKDLLPWVDHHYRTTSLRLLAGHSFGGLFALRAASTEPSPFRIVIAMSPSLWWNDSSAVAEYAGRLLQRQTPVTLFVTSGSLEPDIDQPTSHLVASLDSVSHPMVAMTYRRYLGVGHGLTPFYSLADGLRHSLASLAVPLDSVYATLTSPTRADSASFVAALASLEARYAEAATALDYPPAFPEAPMNAFGYITLAAYPELAVSIFRTNVQRYPESANTYDSLGDGLLAANDTVGAVAAFRQAVAVAARHSDPVGAVSQAKLDKLTHRH